MDELERRAYTDLWRIMSQVPHRVLGPAVRTMKQAISDDPDRAARTLVYLTMHGRIRDLKEAAVIALLQSRWPDYREAGKALLLGSRVYKTDPGGIDGLPPYQIVRVNHYLRSPVTVSLTSFLDGELERFYTVGAATTAMPRVARKHLAQRSRTWRAGSLSDEQLVAQAGLHVVHDFEHCKVSRLRRRIIGDWLIALHGSPDWWYAVQLLNGPALQHLYSDKSNTLKGFRPPEWVRQAIFEGKFPKGTKRAALRQVASPDISISDKLVLVQEHKLDDRVLSSVLDGTPQSWILRIAAMTPRQAVNMRSALEGSGVLEMPEVMEVYVQKVAQATDSVGALNRKSAKGKDAQVEQAVQEAREKAAKVDPIEGEVLVMVDKSSSMTQAISESAPIAARIAAAAQDRVFMSFFDSSARVAEATGMSLAEIEDKTSRIRPGGMTSMEQGYLAAKRTSVVPNKIVVITDGGENVGNLGNRLAHDSWEGNIVTVKIGRYSEGFVANLRDAGYYTDEIDLPQQHDPFVADQVVALLGGPAAMTIADKIAATELPKIV